MVKEAPSRRALKRKLEVPQAVVYGARKNDQRLATAVKQANAIAPVVAQLGDLERRAQQLFARMMWGVYNDDMSVRVAASNHKQVVASTPEPAAPSNAPQKPA